MKLKPLLSCGLLLALAGTGSIWRSPEASPESDKTTIPLVQGLPSLEAVAINPQAVPFLALADQSGRIVRLPGANQTRWLAETGGQPAGLAFDATGDLYVADRRRGIVYRVTPSGESRACAEWMGSPEGVAVGPNAEVYFTDSARGTVFRVSETGKPVKVVTDLAKPKGIVVSMASGEIYVSTSDSRVWQISANGQNRKLFKAFTDAGIPSGMALDEAGNLYVARDGGGRVTVLGPDGKEVASHTVPGPRVTSVGFGGLGLNTLYVTEASTGSLFELPVSRRSQRLPWEPHSLVRIDAPVDGDILNRHDGEETAAGLRIEVRGSCEKCREVRVNGKPATVTAGKFEASVTLAQPETTIAVEAPAAERQEIRVWWDRASFPRYRVSTDDNIMFLKDIAEHADSYSSIFQNPYLAFWREMHQKYGTKVHHNIYYQTSGFDLSQMPDKFRDEWRKNSAWQHLSFHARANDPDRPYIHATADQILADYRKVMREIERFAGPESTSTFTTVHWGETSPEAARALRNAGLRGLVGYFRMSGNFPSVSYYLPLAPTLHLMNRDYWKDTREGLLFVRHDIVINTVPLDQIVPYLEKIVADPHQAEIVELMIHEQYFYPDYRAYEPDFRQRVERAIEFVSKRGYKPVFFEDGFIGVPGEGRR